MTWIRKSLGILMIITLAVQLVSRPAQTKEPSFDVASVKENKDLPGSLPAALRYTPSGVDFARVPLTWVIGEAFSVPYARIAASDPRTSELLLSGRYFYDIAARAEQPVEKEQIRLMLQTLLADRFKLVHHHESKVEPVYKLLVGKSGPRLQRSETSSKAVQPVISGSVGSFAFRHVEMTRFAGFLSGYMGRPVVDLTGLKGFYDFTLKSEGALPDKAAMAEWLSSSVFTDVEKQLGLRLEADKASIEYLIVDHAEKPDAN